MFPTFFGPKGYIRLLNGCRFPILRRGKTVSYAREDQPQSGAASEADTKLRLAHEVLLHQRSLGYVPLQTSFQGNGVITRGCQNAVFWPYPGQNTDIIRNMSQNVRP